MRLLRRSVPNLACVVSETNRNWVLERISMELAARYPGGGGRVVPMRPKLPAAPAYFFSHHSLWPEALQATPKLAERQIAVFFTHPRPLRFSERALGEALAAASVVLPMCTLHIEHLLGIGVPQEKIVLAIPGTDLDFFRPHARGSGAVGLCSAYYERKSPDRILKVVTALRSRQFLLVGRDWRDAPVFHELSRLDNFSYVEAPYDDYPRLYDGMDVFLSLSELEGGPIPLLEAMASNVVPVATRTGFAPDLIRHGENGYLCDVTAPVAQIAELVENAFASTCDVRSTVKVFTYDAFARVVHTALNG